MKKKYTKPIREPESFPIQPGTVGIDISMTSNNHLTTNYLIESKNELDQEISIWENYNLVSHVKINYSAWDKQLYLPTTLLPVIMKEKSNAAGLRFLKTVRKLIV